MPVSILDGRVGLCAAPGRDKMATMLSQRTSWRLDPTPLHQLTEQRRAAGDFIDLTVSNPTRCGFHYPETLLPALAVPDALRYDPHPFGLASAREAVSAYYHARGMHVPVERIALTASTSEAYSHLFRLLCNAGEAVLMPTPSYPLFEMLAGAHDVRLRPAPMLYDHGWQLDLAMMEQAPEDVRALLLVHPNNPAGNYIQAGEWQAVQALAATRGWAVVVDEVFFDFAIPPSAPVALDYSACPALTFLLNGCSKLSALPQMKLAWFSAFGPEELVSAAWARLDVLLDLYLSVSTPAQLAAPTLLDVRHQLQPQIVTRLQQNLAVLDAALTPLPAIERMPVAGGWSALLRLPHLYGDAEWAERLVERAGVLTHPGHFYGLAIDACLALSLLLPPADFSEGVARLCKEIA